MGKENKKKRKSPEEKEWKWDDTILEKEDGDIVLLATDIKQLLITRGVDRKELKSKKENIKNLKENFSVQLDEDFDQYTSKELCAELKLRNMNSLNAKKSILIQRLNGEIDAPPKKKAKKGRKPKGSNKVYVCLYTPAEDEDDANTTVLGVFSSKKKSKPKGHRAINRRYRE